jgi:hypothetical protein
VGILAAFPLFAFGPTAARGDDAAVQEEMTRLKADNALLQTSLEAKSKELEQLKKELARVKALLEKAEASAPKGSAKPASKPTLDGSTAAAEAIRKYSERLAALGGGQAADAQVRKDWIEATKALDVALRRPRAVVSYTIGKVEYDSRSSYVELKLAAVSIQSADPDIPSVTLQNVYPIRIVATPEQAARITKDSTLTLEGTLAVNVDFSRPIAEQPAWYGHGRPFGDWQMSGYRPIGKVKGMADTLAAYQGTILMMQGNCQIKVDGTVRSPFVGFGGTVHEPPKAQEQ